MASQYQLQLVYFKLTLKRKLLSDCTLRLSLLIDGKQVTQPQYVPHESTMEKQRIKVELDSLENLNYKAKAIETALTLKYEIKGKSEERVRNLNVDIAKMMAEYQKDGTSLAEEKLSGAKDDIMYMFSVVTDDTLDVLPKIKPQASGQSNSKDDKSKDNQPKKSSGLLHLESSSMVQHQGLQSAQKDQIVEKQLPLGPSLRKKMTIPQLRKVKELIETHHPPEHESHEHGSGGVSFKLKMVVLLLIIGIGYLLLDTFNDFTGRRQRARKLHAKRNKDKHKEHAVKPTSPKIEQPVEEKPIARPKKAKKPKRQQPPAPKKKEQKTKPIKKNKKTKAAKQEQEQAPIKRSSKGRKGKP